ncbi:MAG: sigma 54-interacting transcriptional regulator [Helicobacteraceae bacterium]|jgi:DNA-binding NtrC family response regulator|nr:sigma 54-interacting transcriptional regulator [Helicobacteraceae bacterium]
MSGFIAAENSTQEIAKTAVLVKSLDINVLITGEGGVGKTTLAKEILPNAAIADGENEEDVEQLLARSESLIIENFDRLSKVGRLELDGKRIVATSSATIDQSVIDRFFGFTLRLPPLRERPKDVPALARAFLDEAKAILTLDIDINLDALDADLSDNAHSLRRAVYSYLLFDGIGEKELLTIMERFLRGKMNETGVGVNIYRDYAYLYDKPLILAGLDKYRSQLRLANALGLNRNTLRKKINGLGIEL